MALLRSISQGTASGKESGPSYDELVKLMGPIAKPLASKKLTKRLLKVGGFSYAQSTLSGADLLLKVTCLDSW